MAESTLPAVDSETKEMLESQVKKGKPRKFILICKGVDIKTLIVFKKGPYGVKITAAKKAGFKGEVYSGVVTGQGVSLTFQLPATDEVLEAMKAEGNVCADEKEPCKIAKLREFLQDEADLKTKPEFQFIKNVNDIAKVTEEGEEQGSLEKGLTKEGLIEQLKKTKPFIEKAITAAPGRKDEVLGAVAKVKQLIEAGNFEEAQTAMLQLGGLLREIIKAAGPQPEATLDEEEGPPTEKQVKKSEWDALLKELTPKLRAFTQFKLGDYRKLGDILKQAQDAKKTDLDQAIAFLKQCQTLVNEIEVKHRRDYEKVRDENATRFGNSEKHEPIKDFISAGRADAAKLATELNFSAAVGRLRELIDLIHSESAKIEQEFNRIYDDVIHKEIAFERDPNTARDEVLKHLKSWDLVAAAAEVKKFKTEMERSKPTGVTNIGEVEKRAKDAKLQNAQYSRNTAMAVNAAKKLIDDKGNLVIDADLLSDLAFTPARHLAGVAEEIARSGFDDLPQTVHALEMLKRLETDEEVRKALNNVKAPTDKDSTAAKMIRTTLGLKMDEKVTDAHARQAALSALLFQARQGDVGSCFTTATAIHIQRNKPEKMLADMQELFSTGKLSRTIEFNGSDYPVESPFNTEMLVSNLEQKVTVPRQGGSLHLAPDMVASLDFLDIKPNDREQAIKDAVQDARAREGIGEAMKELSKVLTPENKIKDVTGEAMKLIRANRSLKIKEALKQAISNLGLKAKLDKTPTQYAKQMGHNGSTAFAKGKGFKDYPDYEKNSGATIQDEWAKTKKGANNYDEWKMSAGLKKCDSFDKATGDDSYAPKQILECLVENKVSADKQDAAKKGANDAFLGQQDNRLMRAWEYTIATLAEQDPNVTSYGEEMNEGIKKAAKEKAKELAADYINDNGPFTPDIEDIIRDIAKSVIKEFYDKLQDRSKSQYDPSVKDVNEAISKDGHSSSGGYSLYNDGKKVDSEAAFNEMLEEAMKDGLAEFDNSWSGGSKTLGHEFATDLLKHAKTKAFRDECIAKNPNSDKDNLATPWTSAEGGDDRILMQFYHDQKTPISKVSSKKYSKPVDNAESLTEFLIDTLKGMKLGDKLSPDKAEHAAVPVASDSHAFSLKPGNPGMLSILAGDKDTATVVADYKKSEKHKNEQRRTTEFVLSDPLDGPLLKLLQKAMSDWDSSGASEIQKQTVQKLKALNKKSVTVEELRTAVNHAIDDEYAGDPPEDIAGMKADSDRDMAIGLLESIVPRDEFEPLIDAALAKLKVPDDKRGPVAKAALATLKDNAADRVEVEKAVQTALKEANVEIDEKRISTAMNEPRGLVFADTNWGDGQHMTQFSMVVNPLTDTIELWQMNEDGTDVSVVDKKSWIETGKWVVYNDSAQIGGATGDNAWETRRGDLQAKLKECVSKRQGNIGMMQNALEIADQKYADGDKTAGGKALDRLESFIKRAAKITTNVEEATKALDQFKKAVENVAIDEAKEAAKFVDALIREVKVLRDENSINDFAARRKSDLELLKEGKQHLGVDIDLETILTKA